ncbi:calpain 7 [Quaeritorhiza haematococci]|nr:calpain 7 [Quaeritorhiza haematococci]
MDRRSRDLLATLNELYAEASAQAKWAVQADKDGDPQVAYVYYTEAAQMNAYKFGGFTVSVDPDELRKQQIFEKAREYVARAEEIKKLAIWTQIPKGVSDLDYTLHLAQFSLEQGILEDEKRNTEEAVYLYTVAAENYMRALKLETDEDSKAKLTKKIHSILNRAESLKKLPLVNSMSRLGVGSSRPGGSGARSPSPIRSGAGKALTQREIEVLRKTSSINGKTFLPWLEIDLKERFTYVDRFSDPDGPIMLSRIQKARFGGWKRPSQIMSAPRMIAVISSASIVQEIVTDCSFVASLSVSAAYERRFKKQLLPDGYPNTSSSKSGESFDPDVEWKRLLDGCQYGDALITIGTGEMTDEEADALGLVPTHAYAVLDVREVTGLRLMQVKNPWNHQRWKENWTPELKRALNYDQLGALQYDDGVPFTFSNWPAQDASKGNNFTLGHKPQFGLEVDVQDATSNEVWILLSKHITVTEEQTDYITLHVYDHTGCERIYYPDKPLIKGVYVNSPHISVRFEAPMGKTKYTVVVSQHEKKEELNFTLRAYSTAPFKMGEIPNKYSFEHKESGEWTKETAGGSTSYASFLNNPNWKVTFVDGQGPHSIFAMIEAEDEHPVNLKMLRGGNRVCSISKDDVVCQSGDYRPGFCYIEKAGIKDGSYTIVASTFDPGLEGRFSLVVRSNSRFTITPVPAEGEGLMRNVIKGAWIAGVTAMGCSLHPGYFRNPRYQIESANPTRFLIRLQTPDMRPTPAVHVAIFEQNTRTGASPAQHTSLNPSGTEIANSGAYTNVAQGVVAEFSTPKPNTGL